MEANDFIAKIKANGTEKDLCDLSKVCDEYRVIVSGLGPKDRAPFSLNVLCIICRNLDKVPSWRERVDTKALLELSIECVRETRTADKPERVKTLACIYHIHKHAVKAYASVPPELILKLSFMPFEYDTKHLLHEYCKTYWSIITDRITYMEKLKPKINLIKLLPKLMQDVVKVVQMYDTVQLCMNILTFLVKKLHFLYNDVNAKELHSVFKEIFSCIQTKMDLDSFAKLTDREMMDLYQKFNDCFYVIAENASKFKFNGCILSLVVETARSIFQHNSSITNCLDTFYLKGFCVIFENTTNGSLIEKTLNQMLASFVDHEKLYGKIMRATYPFMNQLIRLVIENAVTCTNWAQIFDTKVQYSFLNMILNLSTKKSEQFLKCDNCKVKSGLHDSLRLLFLIKHFPSISIAQNMDINFILPIYYKLVTVQHRILHELRALGCVNHEKCFRKLQTDIHNTAITFNKACYYEHSIKLFNLYVQLEIQHFKDTSDLKNISRAFYNKSICELDFKLYEEALKDAYLSLVFALPDGLNTEKYMSLVMDIKAKELKSKGDEEGNKDEFQLLSVLEACKLAYEEKKYGNLRPFVLHLKFSELLNHEFSMYAKLWPSIVPIAGVWRSLHDLLKEKHISWITAENEADLRWTLYKIILETPTVVRTVHSEHYVAIVTELLNEFDENPANTTELKFVQASLLFLKAEYDLAEVGQKHGWKITEPSMDPDQIQATRTLPQEYAASKRAFEAMDILNDAVKDIKSVPPSKHLSHCLQMYQIWVQQFLHLSKSLHALQLAHICCDIASHVSDSEAFLRSATVLIVHCHTKSEAISTLISRCAPLCEKVDKTDAMIFLSTVAIYYKRCGSTGLALRLLRLVQAKILEAYKKDPDIDLDLAVGRLLEAQIELCQAEGATLSAVSNTQRHYLAVSNTATKWSTRRLTALTLKTCITSCSARCVALCVSLLAWRRARGACAAGLGAAGAGRGAGLRARATNTHKMDAAQAVIDNRLKHILGLQPSNDTQEHKSDTTKPIFLTPRHDHLETMLENVVFKKTQTSPSLPCVSVLAFKMPDFFKHSNCNCYGCHPEVLTLACLTAGLESSMYFRAKEWDIARNYFEGTVKSFGYAEAKIKHYFKSYRSKYEGYVVDMVERIVEDEFKSVQIEVLIEEAFFELSQKEYEKADDLIVRIHEIMQDVININAYLKNEVMNLMTTSAQIRKVVKKPVETGLENEMESLKLTPTEEEPRTPITKPKQPPKMTKVVVKSDELPNVKRKVIKLNLDDAADEQEVPKPTRKRSEFKIPVPVTSKPVLESITPRTRSKPEILVTKPSEDTKMTPKVEKTEFFTPISTPAEQFFTPMTSIKTYSKKSLRNNIVKNLEAEFSTPKGGKENSTLNAEPEKLEIPKPSRSTRAKVDRDKKTLKRATSPGKLSKDVKPTRSRLRNPTNFNVHED
ncbi:hypothetical protein ABMA27_012912 [Loxostege sticticalis]|uniref:Uncharacterized protein n=1 Tax=Loxostege sticticalis TaxID=481309 RepID=A0ABR3H109_LOXSC